jgi:predicted transcriptional regulator
MACVNADGTITPTAKALLQSLETPRSAEEIAGTLGLPLFRVRSSLRELVSAGWVAVQDDKYRTTEDGKKKTASD